MNREDFRRNGNNFSTRDTGSDRIIVMSNKEAFEAGLTYKDGKSKNPFNGYLALVDEIHELALSVPMITSTKMDDESVLLKLGAMGREQRARKRDAGCVCGGGKGAFRNAKECHKNRTP